MTIEQRYAELDFIDAYHYPHWRELPEGTKMVPPFDGPTISFEYGHKIDRAERSAELYRIGGLMDHIDAVEITKDTLVGAFGASPERAEAVARAIFARLTQAEHAPILACRVYEVEEEDEDDGMPTTQDIAGIGGWG